MTKKIYYSKKQTSANTQYTTISTVDKITIMQTLLQLLCLINEGDTTNDKLLKECINTCHSRTTGLPKSRNGQNSIASYLGGLIYNLKFGTQRDYTEIQLEAIQKITANLSDIFPTITHLEFYEND